MKKLKLVLFILLVLLIFVPIKARADMFDKPTAEIEVVGVNQHFYFEILIHSEKEVEEVTEDELKFRLTYYYNDNFPLDVLNGYQDNDGYVSRVLYNGPPANLFELTSNKFKVGYYSAPQEFKIAIITNDGNIITSKVVNRKLFFSQMTFDLTGVDLSESKMNAGKVTENIPYAHISFRFIIRVIATVAIELMILALFMYKLKNSYLLVGITNIITQSILTIFMFLGYYFWAASLGLFSVLIVGEVIVFMIEMIFYNNKLKEKSKSRAVLYGFIANLVTFLLSFITISFI